MLTALAARIVWHKHSMQAADLITTDKQIKEGHIFKKKNEKKKIFVQHVQRYHLDTTR